MPMPLLQSSGFLTLDAASLPSGWDLLGAAILGLLIGSFLNVLIYRLPLMLQKEPFNLSVPGSHCPHCQHPLQARDLWPVLSFIFSKGRCRHCGHAVTWRYPAVEVLTATLFAACVLKWGATWQGLAACFFSACVLALAWIDWDTFLLPDALTQPLLWSGLCASALHLTHVPLHEALAGAVGGYAVLWAVYWGFKLCTGKEGLGYGDFKLMAALGAWLGAWALLPVLLMASVGGLVWGVFQKIRGQLGDNGHVPFGPFLASAAWVCMFGGISFGV